MHNVCKNTYGWGFSMYTPLFNVQSSTFKPSDWGSQQRNLHLANGLLHLCAQTLPWPIFLHDNNASSQHHQCLSCKASLVLLAPTQLKYRWHLHAKLVDNCCTCQQRTKHQAVKHFQCKSASSRVQGLQITLGQYVQTINYHYKYGKPNPINQVFLIPFMQKDEI